MKIEDITQSFDVTKYTNSQGQYGVALTNEGDVYDADIIRVTVVDWGNVYLEDNATEGEVGSNLDFTQYVKSLSETLELNDTFSRVVSYKRALQETLQLADSVTAFRIIHKILQETLLLTDSELHRSGKIKTLTETLQLADSHTRTIDYKRILQETLELADSFAKIWDLKRTLQETLELNDTALRKQALHLSFTSSLYLSDPPPTRVIIYGLHSQSEQESVTFADSVSKKISKVLSETLNLQDTYSRSPILFHRTFSSNLAFSDVFSRKQTLKKTLTETLSLLSQYQRRKILHVLTKELVETLVFTHPQPVFKISKVLTETLELADIYQHGNWTIKRTIIENLQLQDLLTTDRWGPFYGILTLKTLNGKLTLKELLAELELNQLASTLTLKEET